MKKIKKSVSIILASLMLVAVIPFTANAKTVVAGPSSYYYEKTPLLELDTLFLEEETTVNGVTISETYYEDCEAGEDGYTLISTNLETNNNVAHAGVVTSLPLNAETQYTIEFYMKRSVTNNVGLLWNVVPTEDGEWTGSCGFAVNWGDSDSGRNDIRTLEGSTVVKEPNYGVVDPHWEKVAGEDGYTKFVIEINGYTSTMYVNDVKTPNAVTRSSYASEYLGLGYYGVSTSNIAEIFSIKGVKVYPGLYGTIGKSLMQDNSVYYYEYNDENLLLHLDTLIRDEATTVNDINISATIYDADTEKGENPYALYKKADAAEFGYGDTGNKALAGVTTDLPINSETKYVIELYMDSLVTTDDVVGFLWTVDATTNSTTWAGSYGFSTQWGSSTNIRTVDGDRHNRRVIYGTTPNYWESYAETEGENAGYTKFIVELDGYTSTIYIHDPASDANYKVGSYTDSYSVNTLGFGFYGYPPTLNGNTVSSGIVAIKDVKVYDGLYGVTDISLDCEIGDTVLTVENLLDANTSNSEYGDVTVTELSPQNCILGNSADAPEGAQADAMYATGAGYWAYAGLNTNLPLGGDSKYTIDFYMKDLEGHTDWYSGFLWTTSSWGSAQGFVANRGKGLEMLSNKGGLQSTNAYGNYGNTAKHWATYAITDENDENYGYTPFTIEIDGYVSTLFVAGQMIGAIDISLKNDGYMSNTLGLGMTAYELKDYTGAVMSIKNVTVRYGNMSQMYDVNFYDGDTELSSRFLERETMLNESDFPTVEPKTEGNIIKWFYKGTNTMVIAPYMVVGNADIEAREISISSYTSIAGMQTTAPTENKQSVRFLARLYTLQASEAGFEVEAKYKDGSTVKNDKTWAVKAPTVYSAVQVMGDDGRNREVSAQSLGAAYIIALAVEDVPTNIGQIDFRVRSYITVNGEKLYSQWATFTTNNGAYAPELAPLS